MKRLSIALAFAAACAQQPAPNTGAGHEIAAQGPWTIDPGTDLNAFFECLEKEGATLVSAHRAGPRAGLPENALETMRATLDEVPALLEVDVATSADGVLYLMHDDTLERTTTGEGGVNALPFAKIEKLALEDNEGVASTFAPPRFSDALAFAKTRTILQVDFKKTTKFEPVIAEIRAAGAERRVILIAYSLGMAQKLHRLAPDMMISLSITNPDDLAAANAAKIESERLLAFTGVLEPDSALYDALNAADVEVIFGTLGRNGVDAMIAQTGEESQYAELSRIGVDILATDRPLEAHAALARAQRAAKAGVCGVKRG